MMWVAKQKIHLLLKTKGAIPAKGFCCVRISQIMIAKLPKTNTCKFLTLLSLYSSFFIYRFFFLKKRHICALK